MHASPARNRMIDEILEILKTEYYPHITAMKKAPGDPNVNDFVERLRFENDMDFSVCEAIQRLDGVREIDMFYELVDISILRGWIVTVAFLTTFYELDQKTDTWMESALFWRNLTEKNNRNVTD